ncbi:Wzz/FepE/Etk N-terminal domain-containing protein [Alicyclobacillus fastidiosus]|uniref:Wzz/FepE/Etk N-terminal domain-containing protein n=1 Tax=Alicyclobacillus fastidiosus TaxID=392011 RepID=A0ABY6ZCR8_9BACL|nr:Wzz/FepE/Etk N-terminal domain-containing protein [Alicyclobacillus fastidiosus]WAH39911.1 Wzz/FepE/Etk N-terminal domain-containing protein [Alicyclobacillus fastidiosus]GMA61185.1 capsular polysaccharide biosynthesis protein [Alicyclobacillus fastidiosus]
MELREYWRVIKKRLLLILFIPIVAGAVSGYYVMKKTPLYTATTTLLLSQSSNQIGGTPDTATYTGVIQSDYFTQMVDAESNLPISGSMIELNFNGQLMSISVTSGDPKFASKAADAAAQTVIDKGPGIIPGLHSAGVLNPATSSPVPLHKQQDVTLAAGIAFLVSLGLAFLLEYLDLRFKTETDIVKYLGIPALGGVAEYRPNKRKKA